MKYCAAIFDMDGLLLDTERVCMKMFQQTCVEFNQPFLEDIYLSIIGRNEAGIEKVICDGYGDTLDYPRFRAAWKQRYNAIVEYQAIPVKAGVIELLDWLRQQNIAMVVATSTKKELALKKLQLAGLSDYFCDVTAGDEVKHGKPDPEIYLLAAQRLAVAPESCIAFEDSNNGVKAAVAANMTTFQIIDLVEPDQTTRALGHCILPSLHHAKEILSKDM